MNFKDARYIYAILHAAVKQSIGVHNLTPTIDFNVDPELNSLLGTPVTGDIKQPGIRYNPEYNPFKAEKNNPEATASVFQHRDTHQDWEKIVRSEPDQPGTTPGGQTELPQEQEQPGTFFQIHLRYIACNVRSGLMLIDQHRAHQRILYEYYLQLLTEHQQASQQQLFPQDFHFSTEDMSILKEIKELLAQLGFVLEDHNNNRIVVKGVPENFDGENTRETLERIIEDYKKQHSNPGMNNNIRLANAMASQLSIKQGTTLNNEQMTYLFNNLFACKLPQQAPDGSPILSIIPLEKLEQFLKEK